LNEAIETPGLFSVAELERIAAYVHGALKYARYCEALSARGADRTIQEAAAQSSAQAGHALNRLQSGGILPADFAPVKGAESLSLSSLASLASKDTPASRELLARLQEVLPAAEAVDRERGNWYADAPAGDTKGTEYADTLLQTISRLRSEIDPPKGKGE